MRSGKGGNALKFQTNLIDVDCSNNSNPLINSLISRHIPGNQLRGNKTPAAKELFQ